MEDNCFILNCNFSLHYCFTHFVRHWTLTNQPARYPTRQPATHTHLTSRKTRHSPSHPTSQLDTEPTYRSTTYSVSGPLSQSANRPNTYLLQQATHSPIHPFKQPPNIPPASFNSTILGKFPSQNTWKSSYKGSVRTYGAAEWLFADVKQEWCASDKRQVVLYNINYLLRCGRTLGVASGGSMKAKRGGRFTVGVMRVN